MSNKQTTVRRITPQDAEFWTDEMSGPVVQRNFVPPVAPGQQQTPMQRRIAGDLNVNVPQQAVMAVDMRTTAVDRARGFSIETHQLSLVTGLLAVLVAVVGFGHPFLALGTLWTFGIWYTLVWLGAWLFHRVISPEGLSFYNAVQMWRYINRRG